MEFSRQEYWSGLPFPSPGDLPDPGIKPGSPALQADSLPPELPGKQLLSNKMGKKQLLIHSVQVYQGHYVNEKSQSQKVLFCLFLLIYKILKVTNYSDGVQISGYQRCGIGVR